MSRQPVHARNMSPHPCSMLGNVMKHVCIVWCLRRPKCQISLGSRISSRRWLTTRDRLRQSLPTQPRPLGHVFTSYWAEPTFKYRVCAHVFAYACLCLLVSFCFHRCSFVQSHFSAGYNGPADECHRVTQKTKLRFTWHLVAEGLNETCDVRLLCHHAARRGVHLPKAWKSKWNLSAEVPPVDTLAHEAVQRARDEFSLSDATKLDCRHTFEQSMRAHAYMCMFVAQT